MNNEDIDGYKLADNRERVDCGSVSESDVERVVMPDYRVLHDKFTDIVAHQINYFDELDKVDIASFTYTEIMHMKEQAVKRYQDDYVFSARVKSVVAMLMQATQEERDDRVAGLPFERFRIVEA